ncbi:hypothetical protein AMECASPLE_030129 [Ameca splendens]|uniref:Uncharacterized protein n=1 Tax=Ameca splendens TaxID=208324 RepID=A0ABV0ZQU2_9TELE
MLGSLSSYVSCGLGVVKAQPEIPGNIDVFIVKSQFEDSLIFVSKPNSRLSLCFAKAQIWCLSRFLSKLKSLKQDSVANYTSFIIIFHKTVFQIMAYLVKNKLKHVYTEHTVQKKKDKYAVS